MESFRDLTTYYKKEVSKMNDDLKKSEFSAWVTEEGIQIHIRMRLPLKKFPHYLLGLGWLVRV